MHGAHSSSDTGISSSRDVAFVRGIVFGFRAGVRDAGNVVYVFVAQAFADVAKLADALGLGSSSRKGVGVQVPSSAPSSK